MHRLSLWANVLKHFALLPPAGPAAARRRLPPQLDVPGKPGGPAGRDALQHNGPNHLGLWFNGLPFIMMALITSDCHKQVEDLPAETPAAAAPAPAAERNCFGYRPSSSVAGGGGEPGGCTTSVAIPIATC